MRLNRSLKISLVLITALMVASAAFAGQRDVFLASGTTLDGTEIPKGQYNLVWKKNGSEGSYDVKVLRGNKVMAKTTGQMVDRGAPADRDQVITKLDGNGGRTIQEIQFRGKTQVLVIDR
jgi:hypothetical protein